MMQKRAAAYKIWKDIFHDDEAFMTLFFDSIYHDSNTLLSLNPYTGTANSHLQFIPYDLCIAQKRYKACYVCGVATIPEAREHGLAKQLLQAAHYRMWHKGAALSFLIPQENWLYDYYRRGGQYVDAGERAYSHKRIVGFVNSSDAESYKQSTLQRQSSLRMNYALPDYLQWRTALESAAMSGGGCAFDDECGINLLYDRITPNNYIAPRPPINGEKMHRFGMVRIIKPFDLLRDYALRHTHCCTTFIYCDNALPMNNGLYVIKNGMVRFFRPALQDVRKYSILKGKEKDTNPLNSPLSLYTPTSLAQFLFQNEIFFLDQLMDGIVE